MYKRWWAVWPDGYTLYVDAKTERDARSAIHIRAIDDDHFITQWNVVVLIDEDFHREYIIVEE